jgi:hypothetical protein
LPSDSSSSSSSSSVSSSCDGPIFNSKNRPPRQNILESDDSSYHDNEKENKTLDQLAKNPKATGVQSSSSASSEDKEDETEGEVAFSDNEESMEDLEEIGGVEEDIIPQNLKLV